MSLPQDRVLPPPTDAPTLPRQRDTGAIGDKAPGATIAGHVLEGELGRGGMGVVYKARHLKLNRVVALKMILAGRHASEAERTRFKAEAESIARLQHPNIVQVHEIGEHEGVPFFSLEFCPGGSLEKQLNGTPLPSREAAALVETLAQAMHAAHQANVIHRDLKPANVLLQMTNDQCPMTNGAVASPLVIGHWSLVIPKITDFGLAKKLDEGAGPTQSGSILGTPSYMAPEQAGGPSTAVGPACDTYALGAILYELLTGRPPFKAATALDTVLQVLSDEPVPPSRLQSKTPPDLETICLKCLRKEPGQRYASAQALSDDLGRFLRGEPVQARPVGRLERGWRWCRRNPAVASLLAGIAVLLLVVAVSSTLLGQVAWRNARQAERKAEEAEMQRHQTQAEKDRVEQLLYVGRLSLVQSRWHEGNVTAARDKLGEVQDHRATWEYRYLYTLMNRRGQRTFVGHTGGVTCVCFSPDGQRLASASEDTTVKVWDAATGQEVLSLQGHTERVSSVCFSPDGQRLASASGDRTVKVWNARTGKEVLTYRGHTREVKSGCFSPDGQRLASASGDGTVKVWDAHTGQEALSFQGYGPVCFSPDGTRLVAESKDWKLKVWDARTGQEGLSLEGHSPMCFSPDGRRIVSGGSYSERGEVKVWDAHTGQQLLSLKAHASLLGSVALSPDGMRIVSAGGGFNKPGEVKVWDAATGQEVLSFRGHTSSVSCVCFSGDGQRLASGSGDKTIKVWDARTGQEPLTLKGHPAPVSSVCFRPDGQRLASASFDRTVRVWDVLTGQEALTLRGHTAPVSSVCFRPDGRRIAAASSDRTVRVWSAATGQQLRTFRGHTREVSGLCFRPDGQRLASASGDGTVKVWDVPSGQEVLTYRGHTREVSSVCFSPDGRHIASAGGDQTVRLWDAATGQDLLTLAGHTGNVSSVCFRPDGTRLASAGGDQTVRLWDAATGREVFTLKGHGGPVSSVSFSPDGQRLASGSLDTTVKVWDAGTGQEVLTLKGHTSAVSGVCFSSDGTRLLSGSQDGTVKVWEATPGQEALTLQGHTSWIRRLGFSPDSKRLVSRDVGGTRMDWDLTTGQPIASAGAEPASASPRSPDGRFFALVEGSVMRVHRLPSGNRQEQAEGRRWVAPDYRWHAARALEAWQAGNWFAAAFHLKQQLPERPRDAGLQARRAYTLFRLGRTAEAATASLCAFRLDPGVRLWPLDPDAARRGQRAAQDHDWPRAAADLALAAHQPRAPLAAWSDVLLVRYATAPKDARRNCRELLDRFEKDARIRLEARRKLPLATRQFLDRFENNGRASLLVLDSCRISPCDEADGRRLVKVAEGHVAGRRNAETLTWLGGALYRAGRFEAAARILQEAIAMQGKGGPVDTWPFLAMTQQRLGRSEEARALLARFERWLKGRKFATWQESIRWRLLHEEVRRTIRAMPRAAP